MKEYTDQKFFYKAVPVDYDGVARLKRIKGNTLAFNQLLQNGNFTSTSGWASATPSQLSIVGASNNRLLFTCNNTEAAIMNTGVSFPSSHKLLFKLTTDLSNVLKVRIYNRTWTTLLSPTNLIKRNGFQYLVIDPLSDVGGILYIIPSVYDNVQHYISNVQVFDLTMMGIDTIDQFESFFPLPYYSYQSTLLPFKGTAIKTVGKNQIDATQAQNNALTTMETSEGTVHGTYTGTSVYAGFNFLRNPHFADTHLKGKYRLSFDAQGITSQWTIGLRRGASFVGGTESITWISSDGHYSFIIDTSTNKEECYISFCRTSGTGNMDVTFSNIQLELGETETEYTPYVESTTNLPTLTYFLNGMKSAGSVYDELTESKAITRVGEVDASSNWSYPSVTSAGGLKYVELNDSTIKIDGEGLCNLLGVDNSTAWASTVPVVQISTSANRIRVYGNFSSLEDFQSQYASIKIFYELATETETEINEDIFYRFYQHGTEQILPINGAIPTTAPIWCDIEYYNQIESEIPYRKFWLVNGNGEKWNLTEKEIKSFLNNPSGLGFRKSIEITRYGERANKINEVYDFPQPQGELLFYDSVNSSRYDKYYEFTRFVMNQPITLYYQIPVSYNSMIADTYKLDCEVTELQKTESKPDRIMTTQIVFSGLGFYEGEEIEINGTGTTYTIENKGDFPVGFEITLEGSLMNPYITLSQDGEMYGEAKFDDTTAFSSVYVDSKDGEQNVILKQSGSILPNPLSYQDLSISNGSIYVTFVKLLRGVTELTIGRRSGSLTGVKIKYSPKYRSV